MFLQYFDTVGWVLWPVKTVAHITYTVLVETLNPAQSINQSTCVSLSQWIRTSPRCGARCRYLLLFEFINKHEDSHWYESCSVADTTLWLVCQVDAILVVSCCIHTLAPASTVECLMPTEVQELGGTLRSFLSASCEWKVYYYSLSVFHMLQVMVYALELILGNLWHLCLQHCHGRLKKCSKFVMCRGSVAALGRL